MKNVDHKQDPTGKLVGRLDAGHTKPETVIEIVKVSVTFDQVKKFFRKLFHR
jgi:hypothetical protein